MAGHRWREYAPAPFGIELTGMSSRRMPPMCCARRRFTDLFPDFSLGHPRLIAWGKGALLLLKNAQGDA